MKFLLKSLVSICLILPLSIAAQESDQIEEVIVNATKKDASAQDVPIALDVITSDQIDALNIDTLRDIAARIPTLTTNYNTDPFQSSIRIRGIGSSQSDASLEAGVAIIVDGVYLNRTGLGLNDLTDIERVEVLQGPQGTLYGKNSNAGVINITTKSPIIGDDEGFIEVESGDYGQHRVTGSISKSISDSVALRFSFNSNESDGWMTNATDGTKAQDADDKTYSLKLYLNPTDQTSLVFTHTDLTKNANCCAADSFQNAPIFLAGSQATGRKLALGGNTNDFIFSGNDRPAFTLDTSLTSIKIDSERDNGILTIILAQNEYDMSKGTDVDFSGIDLLSSDRFHEASSTSQEIRFASNMIGSWEYLLGFYNYESDLREYGNNSVLVGDDWDATTAQMLANFNASPQGAALVNLTTALTNLRQTTQNPNATLPAEQMAQLAALTEAKIGLVGLGMVAKSGDRIEQDMLWNGSMSALFGTATNHLSDTLRFNLGIRYADETKDADLYAQTFLLGTMAAPATLAAMIPGVEEGDAVPRQLTAAQWRFNGFLNNVDDTFTRNTTSTTYSMSLQKDLEEDIMVYASYSTGFKSGGFNATGEDEALGYAREYKDEESTNFEVGIKSIINNGKTQVNATIFNMETENLQGVKQLDSGTGTVVYNSSIPAKRLGIDLNVVTKITPNLVANLGYMKLDDDDADISTNAAIRLTPKMAYNVGLSHFTPLYNGKIHSRIDYSYDDEMEVTSNYSTSPAMDPLPASYKEKRDRRNLNVKIAWSNENLEVAYWAKNKTDEFFERLVTAPNPLLGDNFAVFLMAPKTQGFSIKYNF